MKLLKWCFISLIAIINLNYADIILTAQFQNLTTPKEEPMNQTIYIGKNSVRIDIKNEKSDLTTIFLGDKHVFWIIDHMNKTYTEINQEDLEKMQSTISETSSVMEKTLKDLPQAQQEKIKGIMKNSAEAKSKIIFKRVSRGEKVNQWLCDKYNGFIKSQKVMELWTTDWKKLGIKLEDIKVLDRMHTFIEKMIKNVPSLYAIETEKKDGLYLGAPVKVLEYEKGNVRSKYELKEIRFEELSLPVFLPPPKYKREKFGADGQ